MKKIFVSIFVAVLLLIPFTVTHAQFGGAIDNLKNAVGDTGLTPDFAGSVSTVVKAILALVGTIFFLLTIYAGILWMTARGDEGKVEKAVDIIRASIIGLIITLSAYAITFFVTSRLGAGGSPSSTALGCCVSKDKVNLVCAKDVKKDDCRADTADWYQTSCPAQCNK